MARYQRKSLFKRVNKLVIPAVLLLAVAGWLGWRKFYQQKPADTAAPDSAEAINYGPATEEEKAETEAHKKQLAQEPTTNTSSSKKSVKPVITFAGQYGQAVEVGSYVGEVYEDGGTCTLTLTKGSQKITKTATGQKDVSTTLCPTFSIPRSELSAGTWTATVSYNSSSAQGTSDSKAFEVE